MPGLEKKYPLNSIQKNNSYLKTHTTEQINYLLDTKSIVFE